MPSPLLSTSLSVCGHDPEVNVLPFGSQICLSLYCLKNPLFITAGFLPTVYLPAVLAPPLAIVIVILNPPPPNLSLAKVTSDLAANPYSRLFPSPVSSEQQ